MIKHLLCIVALLIIVPVHAQTPTTPQEVQSTPTVEQTINVDVEQEKEVEVKHDRELSLEETIDKFSAEYNVPKAWLINLAKCESTMGTRLIGDNGQAYGVYQYHVPTWLDFEKWSGMNLNRQSQYDQVHMTAWALSAGKGGNWSCDYRTGKPRQ